MSDIFIMGSARAQQLRASGRVKVLNNVFIPFRHKSITELSTNREIYKQDDKPIVKWKTPRESLTPWEEILQRRESYDSLMLGGNYKE